MGGSARANEAGMRNKKVDKINYIILNYLKSITYNFEMVPGGGFEPPTRGFSVHCSTPELPGHIRQNVVGAKCVW